MTIASTAYFVHKLKFAVKPTPTLHKLGVGALGFMTLFAVLNTIPADANLIPQIGLTFGGGEDTTIPLGSMYPWKYIGLIGLMLVGFFVAALYLRATATGFQWGRASRWSQFALIVCAVTVVLTMVTMGYTRETARRVDNDPGYLITTASRRSRSSRRGHVLQARALPVVWNKGCTGDGSGPAPVRAFRGGHLLLRLLHDPDHRGRFRALHLLDKQGRIVRGIAVARTEKASIRVEVACDPCKRQRRERRHY
jgi:hypothetical protein